MDTIRVDENCAVGVELAEREFGHMYVRCSNPFDLPPTYWGEIELCCKSSKATFFYSISEFCLVKKFYKLSVFSDRELTESFLDLDVKFKNGNPRMIRLGLEINYTSIEFIPPELIGIIHVLAYQCISQVQPTGDEKVDGKTARTLMNYGFIFGITPEVTAYFESETHVPFETLVSTVNLLLR